MLNDSYKILGVDEYATDREISEAYFALRKKYLEERFAEGEKGNEAAKMLTKIDGAYDEITRYRRERSGMTALSTGALPRPLWRIWRHLPAFPCGTV